MHMRLSCAVVTYYILQIYIFIFVISITIEILGQQVVILMSHQQPTEVPVSLPCTFCLIDLMHRPRRGAACFSVSLFYLPNIPLPCQFDSQSINVTLLHYLPITNGCPQTASQYTSNSHPGAAKQHRWQSITAAPDSRVCRTREAKLHQ